MVSLEACTCGHALKFMFKASNNEVKYEVVLTNIEICNARGVEYLKALHEFQLMVSQVKGEYEAHDTAMVSCSAKVKAKSSMFNRFESYMCLDRKPTS